MNRVFTILLLAALLAAPNVAMSQLSLSTAPAAGAPTGYKAYDFFADVTTDMGVMELLADSPGASIYQNYTTDPDNPNEAFASYVTANKDAVGANPAQTLIYGGAVNLGGGATETFDNSTIDIAWSPEGGTMSGAGTYHVGRIVRSRAGVINYELMGLQTGGDPAETISGSFGPELALRAEEIAGAPAGYRAYDFYANLDTNMGVMELMIDSPGASIYQNYTTDPDNPNEAFASYVTANKDAVGANPGQTLIYGGAVNLGGGATETFDNSTIDIAWSPEGGTMSGYGDYHVARVVVQRGGVINYEMMGMQTGGYDPETISGSFGPELALRVEEVAGAPAGKQAYDFYANLDTNMGVMELMVDTYYPGHIYQNYSTDPDNPNETFASYVTANKDAVGANPAQTLIYGGAVNLGGGATETFDNSTIDIAWSPEGGTMSGYGDYHIARVVLDEHAIANYQLVGMQTGGYDSETISGTLREPFAIEMVQVIDPSGPAGHTTYDLYVDVQTHMGVMQLMLTTTAPGDIYQNSLIPDDAAEEFDTYVTVMDAATPGENPAGTFIYGGAIKLGGGVIETFDNSTIDIAWGPEVQTGSGRFQIARITLKNGTIVSWDLRGLQVDELGSPFLASGTLSLLLGDVNGDGFVGGGDLNAILSNWGLAGASRRQGDLTGEGNVGGADYNEVLGHWGEGTQPPEPRGGAIPEPATLILLITGGLALLHRRR